MNSDKKVGQVVGGDVSCDELVVVSGACVFEHCKLVVARVYPDERA